MLNVVETCAKQAEFPVGRAAAATRGEQPAESPLLALPRQVVQQLPADVQWQVLGPRRAETPRARVAKTLPTLRCRLVRKDRLRRTWLDVRNRWPNH